MKPLEQPSHSGNPDSSPGNQGKVVRMLGDDVESTQIPVIEIRARKEHLVWRDGGAYLIPFITSIAGVIVEQYLRFNLNEDLTLEGIQHLIDRAMPVGRRPYQRDKAIVLGKSLFHDEKGVGSMARKFETLGEALDYFKVHGGSEDEFVRAKQRLEKQDYGVETIDLIPHEENQGVFASLNLHKMAEDNEESSYVARFKMNVEVVPDDGQTLFEILCQDETFLRLFIVLGVKRLIDLDAVRKNKVLINMERIQRKKRESGESTIDEEEFIQGQKELAKSEQYIRNRAFDGIIKDLEWAESADALFEGLPREVDGLVREVNSNFRLRYLAGIPLEQTSVAHFAIEQLKVITELARNNSLALWFLEEFKSEGIAALIDQLGMFGGLENVDIFTGMLVEHKALKKAVAGGLNRLSVIKLINNILRSYSPKEVAAIQDTELFNWMIEDLDQVTGLLALFMDEKTLQAFKSGIRREVMENVAEAIDKK